MKILFIFLGVLLGVIVFLLIIALIIWTKIKASARKMGLNDINFRNIFDEIKKGINEDRYNEKHISGMTKLLIPNIERDFKTFNESELYNKTETGLRTIFNSLEKKEINNTLPLLKGKLNEIINDYKSSEINVSYDDIVFHKFALKKYYKKDGVATIQVQTSLEYYYKKEKNHKIIDVY